MSGVAFPLTPTLSLGEMGNHLPLHGGNNAIPG